jgi:MFS family permease
MRPRAAAWKLTVVERRQAMRQSYRNAGLWAIGNGLTSTTLMTYLAITLGAKGLVVSLLIAAPQIAGLLRLATPALVGRLGDRKSLCIRCYIASGLLLVALPMVAAPGRLPSPAMSLAALVVLWCLYHLAEYVGTVALWAWLADLVPGRIRGRFVGRREVWLTLGRIAGMLGSGLFSYWWRQAHHGTPQEWLGYALPAALGAAMMIAAVVPLFLLPATNTPAATRPASLGKLWQPLADRQFWPLLAFGCWFSLFNGVTQAAQSVYQVNVLGFSLLAMLAMQTAMRFGQSTVARPIGRWVDRIGNRPVMIASQALVACGLLFYYAARPGDPWWLAGAWAVWIAYVGLNVALPNLMLKTARDGNAAPYAAAYFGITGLFFGGSTVLGGWLTDVLAGMNAQIMHWGVPLVANHFDLLFLGGFAARLAGVVWLLAIVEPGAVTWRSLRPKRGASEIGAHPPA